MDEGIATLRPLLYRLDVVGSQMPQTVSWISFPGLKYTMLRLETDTFSPVLGLWAFFLPDLFLISNVPKPRSSMVFPSARAAFNSSNSSSMILWISSRLR